MPELSQAEKVAIAIELGTEVLVGILRRRALAKGMDIGTLLTEATANSQEADQILDRLQNADVVHSDGTAKATYSEADAKEHLES